MRFSFSTLNLLHEHPHCFLMKMMGIVAEDKPEYKEGREAHRIIQDHISGKKIDTRLAHIKETFEIVERVDFDKRCGFEFELVPNKYTIFGYVDGHDKDWTRLLEIKSAVNPWSMKKFIDSPQRKIYALSHDTLKEAVLITGQRDTTLWETEPPKVFVVPLTEQDRTDAVDWISKGIEIFENGDFTTDLVDGKCIDRYCWWGNACQFK
jgi:hypothetical protein